MPRGYYPPAFIRAPPRGVPAANSGGVHGPYQSLMHDWEGEVSALVFRAKDTRVGRHVAIKIIRPETLSTATRAAFLQ